MYLIKYIKEHFLHMYREIWSAREDSNLRPTGPKPVALPGCATRRKILYILHKYIKSSIIIYFYN